MNQRFMLPRRGESPTWQEMLAIGLAIVSILNMLSYEMWKEISHNFSLLLVCLWAIAGITYLFFGPLGKQWKLFWICAGYSVIFLFLPWHVYPIVGIIVGTLMSAYIGKDFYKIHKEEK